ncbi:SLC13 family permease [Neomoorella humiferrea]|uniref:SLC13 family permease n=1 Tax=Neomoorella humiferrea TaxID=676965 RepID=UPI003D9015DF
MSDKVEEVKDVNQGDKKPNDEKKAQKYKPHQLFIAAIGIIGLILIWIFTPTNIGLKPEGIKALAILFFMVMWWISGICDILVTGLLGIGMMLLFKVATVQVVFSGFSDSTVVFLVFAFGIAAAVSKTGLGTRIAYTLMARTKPKYTSILITYVLVSIALGALIPSGSARTVLLGAIGMMLLPVFGQPEDKMSNVGRGIFTALGLTGYMGSTGYLTGGASIILTVGLLQKAGHNITYLQWLIMTLPVIVVIAVILALALPRIFPPEIKEVDERTYAEFRTKLQNLGPMSADEKKAAIIIGIVILLWVIGDFIGLSYLTVGVAGAVALMFPFINVVTPGDFNKKISWDTIYFVGCCMTLGSVLINTKVTDFLAQAVAPFMSSSSLIIFCIKIWFIATFIHFILPSSLPAFATFMPIIIASAQSQGFSVVIPIIIFALAYTGIVLVYQQVHAAIAYGFHQFEAGDFQKPGLLLILLWLIFTPILVWYLRLLGF